MELLYWICGLDMWIGGGAKNALKKFPITEVLYWEQEQHPLAQKYILNTEIKAG